jgi:hypothetical protein
MHQSTQDLPIRLQAPGAVVRSTPWDSLLAEHMQFAAGTDLTPLLQGLPGDLCECPHWGYVLKGSMHVRYTGGEQEHVPAGHLFHLHSGHTVWTDEDLEMVLFSHPSHEKVFQHIEKQLAG